MREQPRKHLFREALVRFLASPPTFGVSRVPSQPTHTLKAGKRIEELFGDLEARAPKLFDLEQIWKRVRTAWKNRDLDSLSVRDVRMTPWVLFYPTGFEKKWLALDEDFLREYDRLSRERRSDRPSIILLREFLRAGKPEHPTYELIREILRKRLLNSRTIVVRRWKERCANYGFLLKHNEAELLKAWRQSASSASEFLAKAGLSPGLENSDLVHRAVAQLLLETRKQLASNRNASENLRLALTWLELNGKLRLETLRLEIARCLLEPFVDRKPEPSVAGILRAFFLNCFGDPRLGGIAGWAGVPEEQRRVLLRMLVELALEDFFRLLDRTALDRHWRFRKAFWTAYLDKELITDAWMVLGPAAAREARRHLDQDMSRSAGRLRAGTGVLRDHSVLLMRIGPVTVAEWSHNGCCRFWLDGNRRAPRLYERQYKGSDLNHYAEPIFQQRHAGSERGAWQHKIANWLRDQTGFRMSRRNYML